MCKHTNNIDPNEVCIDCILEARAAERRRNRPVEWSGDLQRPIIRLLDEDAYPIENGPYIVVDTAKPRPANISPAEWEKCVSLDKEEMEKPF